MTPSRLVVTVFDIRVFASVFDGTWPVQAGDLLFGADDSVLAKIVLLGLCGIRAAAGPILCC